MAGKARGKGKRGTQVEQFAINTEPSSITHDPVTRLTVIQSCEPGTTAP
jgi:hypothetical protein